MVALRGVTRVFGKKGRQVRALDGVDLEVPSGEFVVVKGPSGSGKSTLLLTAGGMIRPTDGTVALAGQDIYSLPEARRARLRATHIGFVFQMFHLVPYLSALENVCLPSRLGSPPASRDDARELVARFGLSERADHRPAELSTGERQRVAVARAMVNRPQVILADEPTGNLDPESGAYVLDALSAFNRQGGTVLLVTHEEWVERAAHRVVQIRAGRLV